MKTALLLALVSGCALGFEAQRGERRGLAEVGAFFGTSEPVDDEPHLESHGVRARFQLLHGAVLGWSATVGLTNVSAAPSNGASSGSYRMVTFLPELVLHLGSRFAFHGGAGPTYGRMHNDTNETTRSTYGGQALLAADIVVVSAHRYAFRLRPSVTYISPRHKNSVDLSGPLATLEGIFVFR